MPGRKITCIFFSSLLVLAMLILASACFPTKDGIDFAYGAYQEQRSNCRSVEISQRDACMHVAAEQMLGSVENHLSQFGPLKEKGNLMQKKFKNDADINTRQIELPAPAYIPPKPQAGPTRDALVERNSSEAEAGEESDDESKGDSPEQTKDSGSAHQTQTENIE